MAAVDLDHVTVRSGTTTRLSEVAMSIGAGLFVGVVGGSGAGKTSLLRAIAGLDAISAGRILLDGVDVTRSTPGERDVGMVFQSPALIGHLSARRNVSFPLDIRRLSTDEIDHRVDAEVRALHIEQLMAREPSTLSLGEQQLVQIARALVRVPTVLLLDEPFAALDDHLRRRLRAEIAILQAGYGVTTVMATNDCADVEALTSMVAVLDGGRLMQWDTTSEVRRSPATLLAAVATGPISLIEVTVIADQQGFWLVREDPDQGELVRLRAWAPSLAASVGRKVVLGVRPEDVAITGAGSVPARVARALPIAVGGIECTVAGARLTVTAPPGSRPIIGDAVRLRFDHYTVFDRATDAAIG
jgi:ABC-type sugar transport system ATPase subunit